MIPSFAAPPSVLVVEDERIVAKDLQQILQGLGYDASAIASSAEEALAKVREGAPDVVLMDIRIRGSRDGIDVAHELRERFDLPVIYLTAHADAATVERARKTQPHGYLLKPVRGPELRIAVEIALYKRQIDRALRERERWHETTLQSIADAVVSVDGAGLVSFVNRAAEGLLATRRAEAVGFPISSVLHPVDASGAALGADVDGLRALSTSRRSHLLRVGDTVKEVRVRVDPVVSRGEALGWVVVLRDTTEERKIQRQIELADRMSTVATMVSGLAAEVHNPLAILAANATFAEEELDVLRGELSAVAPGHAERLGGIARLVGNARTAGLRITKLVADLRTFALAPQGGDGERAEVSHAIAQAVVGVTAATQDRARVVVEVDEGLAVALAPARLVQALSHLLTNAAEAIPPGDPGGNTIAVMATAEGGEAVIRVRDTGRGVPEEHRERIFEPFFTTKDVGAAGLGLSVCAGIAASGRGRIELEAGSGPGATLRLVLPSA